MPIRTDRAWDTAMLSYGDRLKSIVAGYKDPDLLELGAGRRPSFTQAEMPGHIGSYTVNDISADELALLPDGYDQACFDVSGDASNFSDTYDVVFSRFLAEHVPDGEAMHRNVFNVLRQGGTAFHLLPTLYAVPFVINKYMPESLSSWVLKTFAPRRSINPKFPAPYSACYSSPERMGKLLGSIGYSSWSFQNFYGHFYYEKIPVLRAVHERFSALVADRDWHVFGTYATIIARK